MKISSNEFESILRNDFYAFVERCFRELHPQTEFLSNWHLELIAAELENCRVGKTTRLIVNVPPRSLKSICCSVALPAWILGHNPSEQIICASYAQDLANKHSMDCRSVMSTAWYQRLFPARLSPQKQSLQEFVTVQKGARLATSVGGVLTGRGADWLIIDDPLKPDEALSDTIRNSVNNWFDHTLYSRLNNKSTGRIIVVMQRLHEDDLVGHLLGLGDWKVLRLPAIAEVDEQFEVSTTYGVRSFSRRAGESLHPDREPLPILEDLRRTQGEYNFAGQYQQSPSPLGGGLVKAEWFKIYKQSELPNPFELTFQSWDTACKSSELNDYSVCTTWGLKGKRLYLLNVFRRRVEYPELKRMIIEQAKLYGAKVVLIEDKASGTQLIQDLIADGFNSVKRYVPKLEKVLRLNSVTNLIENGFVYLPENEPWLAEYIHELVTFPRSKYDDQADSTSQALDWVKARTIEPAIVTFWRWQVRADLLAQGRLAELREHDLKYPQDI
jgi:predicted phage terminase large subunit-like protein